MLGSPVPTTVSECAAIVGRQNAVASTTAMEMIFAFRVCMEIQCSSKAAEASRGTSETCFTQLHCIENKGYARTNDWDYVRPTSHPAAIGSGAGQCRFFPERPHVPLSAVRRRAASGGQ